MNLSPFPLHFLILSPFSRSPAARLPQVVQPCTNASQNLSDHLTDVRIELTCSLSLSPSFALSLQTKFVSSLSSISCYLKCTRWSSSPQLWWGKLAGASVGPVSGLIIVGSALDQRPEWAHWLFPQFAEVRWDRRRNGCRWSEAERGALVGLSQLVTTLEGRREGKGAVRGERDSVLLLDSV